MGDSFSYLNNSLAQRGKDGLGIHMLFGRDVMEGIGHRSTNGQSRKRKKNKQNFLSNATQG